MNLYDIHSPDDIRNLSIEELEFLLPELSIRGRHSRIPASRMSVPKAAMYKYCSMILWKNNVRFTRIPAVVLTIPVSFGKQILSHDLFRFCIHSAYMRHIKMPLFLRQHICH